jgi:type I restriction enzyme R subunit
MYVDKKLSGVQCVQTLSRLNRTKSGKTDTFVLDFVNDTENIVESFQPFYTSTVLTGETEPDILYDLQY